MILSTRARCLLSTSSLARVPLSSLHTLKQDSTWRSGRWSGQLVDLMNINTLFWFSKAFQVKGKSGLCLFSVTPLDTPHTHHTCPEWALFPSWPTDTQEFSRVRTAGEGSRRISDSGPHEAGTKFLLSWTGAPHVSSISAPTSCKEH